MLTQKLNILADDAHIRLARSIVQPVSPRRDVGVSLDDYMRLPVEQARHAWCGLACVRSDIHRCFPPWQYACYMWEGYITVTCILIGLVCAQYCNIPMPMQAKLVRTDRADEFALAVPPIRFAVPGVPLTVSPSLLATVTSEPDRVSISSDACTLSGSPLIESLRLNERFDFRVRTVFTWADGAVGGAADGAAGGAEIRSSSKIEVDVETPKLFALMPRPLLEAIATAAMRIVLDALQQVFVRNLAEDYERWVTDAGYRATRAEQRVPGSTPSTQ